MVLMLTASSARAASNPMEAGETFRTELDYSAQHDSNLFRLADEQRPVIDGITGDRSDTLQTGRLGFQFDHIWGRQRVSADAGVARTIFSNYDFLNYTAKAYDVSWAWGLGKRWLGTFSASQAQAERSFADFVSTARSINTYRNYAGSANMWLLAEWTAGFGYARAESRFDDPASVGMEYNEDAWDARLTFRPPTGNNLSIAAREARGHYLNRIGAVLPDNGYRQRDLRIEGQYALGGRGTLSGYFGIARRTYPISKNHDYSGPIGRIGYDWSPASKMKVGLQLRRELGAQEDLTDTYVVTTAIGVNFEWAMAYKLNGKLWGEKLTRDYKGDPGLGFTPTQGQKDKQLAYGATLTYQPNRHFDVSLTAVRDAREKGVAAQYSNLTGRLAARFYY